MVKNYSGDTAMINNKLMDLGVKIGERMADEFLAYRTNEPCSSIKDVADRLIKVSLDDQAFKYYLNVTCDYSYDNKSKYFHLQIPETPFESFVVLPESLKDLQYCNVMAGAVKGALAAVISIHQVNVNAACEFVKDRLHGDPVNLLRVTIKPSGFDDLKDYQE